MKNPQTLLSPVRINRIRAQGYRTFSDQQVIPLATVNRYAYRAQSRGIKSQLSA